MPDGLGRIDDEAWSSLHTRLADDESLRAALQRVAEAGCRVLTDCVGASVTIVERGRATTVGSSSQTATSLDEVQYDAGAGPCLTAAIEGRVVVIDDIGGDARWPEFRRVALGHGLRSSLSTPLALGGGAVAGLNVYGRTVGAFGEDDQRLALAFAGHAAIVVSNAQS